MTSEDRTTQNNSFCETVTKILQSCVEFTTNFSFGHPIYPLEPAAPPYSEYLAIDCQRRLRIIHIKPNSTIRDEIAAANKAENRKKSSLSSLTEEYWFTRWNKPLKLGNCNCSFRRSQRFSLLSNQSLRLSVYQPAYNCITPTISINETRKSNLSNYDSPPTRITNIETFVERLIQESLFEAFQEYFMKTARNIKSNIDGTDNFGYEKGEDEFDGVVLRRTLKDSIRQHSDKEQSKCRSPKGNSSTNISSREKCIHKKEHFKKKPIVLLLHGIGSTADVWWAIINTLVYKGYEVIAPDMLGHGYSSVPDKPGAYKFQNLLKHTLAIFDHYIGCDEANNSIVIGHSYGCSLATALCRYRAQQIIQLILISGGGPTPLAPPVQRNETSIFYCLQSLLKPLLICGVKRTIFYSSRGKHFDVCCKNNAISDYILKYIVNGQNWPEGDAAFHRRILIPTLLVHGLQDSQVTLVQECEMERTIPRAFLELIPNAGHMCMLETPEHLSHMIMCFIDWWSR